MIFAVQAVRRKSCECSSERVAASDERVSCMETCFHEQRERP